MRLTASSSAPGQARAFTASTLDEWRVPQELLHDALVVVSELVSNAVQHGAGDAVLELVRQEDRLLLRVGDDHAASPQQQAHDPSSSRGRGLVIVEAVSTRWGHSPRGAGKWVWAEFALDALVHAEGERVS